LRSWPSSGRNVSAPERRRLAQGASVKAVQKQLGHATASITLDVYGHLFPDELDAVADREAFLVEPEHVRVPTFG
jgi:integrase